MDHRLLTIYVNDHLAGSVVGKNLAKRIAHRNDGNELGRQVAEIAREIEEDQAILHDVMRRAGVRRKRIRLAIARAVEMATRLKPNGRLVGYSPLSRVMELEGLTMGITGKLELWRSLRAVENDPEVPDVDYERMAARAEDQRDRVEELRIKAAAEALSGSPAP
ncbi:MAG TPA: hypothetical protein VH501_00495 [Solirubrobacterales bacterium]|jgi:hypothetical protein